ncbi:D-arabinono-1,4-lactone oxidase [Chitinivibrio alkaliphilus]|uniref:D-arabinono-14-lactone oxidase n=1 Tax=Chitinivibrio alkaliphilus ACht1 TaxID=1313304 RepID=U7D4B5_9BACT|nr:D-arabinono-1,4-lactone oxidase [Chitinivibrio alkaliphilus]ERP31329.1 D-arabinono-14-lactone oxidase [Chitinivibrio alkaliphilus ACht1]
MTETWTSWNGNICHPFSELHVPETEEDLCRIVANAPNRVRAFGNRYSSADIAAGAETLISLRNYRKITAVDRATKQVTVQSGITLKELCQSLEEMDLSFPALPDIDDITLGGAVATGTHGTGRDAQLLSEYMIRCTLVKADGSLEQIDTSSPKFDAVKVSLGLLGIFSTMTFQVEERSSLHIWEEPHKDIEWVRSYEKWLAKNPFLRILWMPHTNHGYVIRGNDPTAVAQRSPLKKAPWYYRYRRNMSQFLYRKTAKIPPLTALINKCIYLLFFTRRQVKEGSLYETTVTKSRSSTLELAEWTIARKDFPRLMKALRKKLHSPFSRYFAHIPMDIRFIQKDTAWLSNAYNRDMVTVGCVTRNASKADSYKAFQLIEELFLAYGGRPHWAKRFSCGPEELARLYPRWHDFIELRRAEDPKGVFLTPHLEKLFA